MKAPVAATPAAALVPAKTGAGGGGGTKALDDSTDPTISADASKSAAPRLRILTLPS